LKITSHLNESGWIGVSVNDHTTKHMDPNAYLPAAPLRPFIRTYLIMESPDELVNRVLPDTSLVMTIRYNGLVNRLNGFDKTAIPGFGLSGIRKSVRLYNYTKATTAILVVFRETGAAAFFKEPLHELFERNVSMDHFIRQSRLSILEEQLAAAADHPERIALVNGFLSGLLQDRTPDKLVLAALEQIKTAQGFSRVTDLHKSLYISQDAFEKRFRKIVGATPKQFASIVRMRTLLRKGSQFQSFTQMAFDAGYFDQAHFNKGFKMFTGLTPGEFFKEPVFW
jgi:AraC-like DNA-binding protein